MILQDSRVLHCYNAHNDYVITLKAFNEVCSNVIESHQPSLLNVSVTMVTVYLMSDHVILQDMQGIHNDLTRRMDNSMKLYITLTSEKVTILLPNATLLIWAYNYYNMLPWYSHTMGVLCVGCQR